MIAGLALNLLGTAVALHVGGTMDWAKFSLMQVVISSSQLSGALANEFADIGSDRLNKNRTWFSGGSGMVVSGRIEVKIVVQALVFWTVLTLAASLGLALMLKTGIVSLLLIVVGLSLALSYSLRPLALSYRGLGEIEMAFMVSFLTPVASFYVMFGTFDEMILLATAPIVFQMMGLMMVVEFPDRDADIAAGKRTLVARMRLASSWSLGVLMLVLGGAAALVGGFIGLPSATAALAGAVLLAEALVFWILGNAPESRSKSFWSTAISCGFYVLVIMIIAVTIATWQ